MCHLSKFIILVPSRLVYDVSRRGDESTHTERAAPMATPVPELSTLTLVWAPHLTWAHPDRTLLVAVVRESCQGLRIEEICIMRLVAPYHARKILEHLSGLLHVRPIPLITLILRMQLLWSFWDFHFSRLSHRLGVAVVMRAGAREPVSRLSSLTPHRHQPANIAQQTLDQDSDSECQHLSSTPNNSSLVMCVLWVLVNVLFEWLGEWLVWLSGIPHHCVIARGDYFAE